MDEHTSHELAYKKGYDKGYEDAWCDGFTKGYSGGYEVGFNANKWIPVTERLPELWQDCFVLVKMKYDWEEDYEYNVDAGCYVGENGYIDSFNTYNDWNEGQDYIHVTHWMPLPEPPKGE